MFDLELMRRLSAAAAVSEAEVEQLRQSHDERYEANFESLEAIDPKTAAMSDADVAALISRDARDTVIGFEVGNRQTYEKKYVAPEWPKGASGVTIGIGYDIGYHTAAEIQNHWANLIPSDSIQRLLRAVGVKGASAGAIISDFKDIKVPWDAAIAAYERSTMPKYGRLVLSAFPNSETLHGHCFGALFSLVFNRGAAMNGDRRKEMRNIRDSCRSGNFDAIPAELRAMKRLWAGQGLSGLEKRRDAEAIMFERGLELMQKPSAVASVVQAESLGGEIPVAAYDGDGQFADEDERSMLEAAVPWDDVKWPANDTDAPDYAHITDRSLSGTAFEFDGRALELLIRANSFEPTREHGRIIFALRGAQLVTSLTAPTVMQRQLDRATLTLSDCRPDHKEFRCVIGVYDLTTNRLSGFASSTVPNRGAVAGYYANQQAGNMMPTGCYRFEVNWHLASKPDRKMPGCLVENGRQKCVHRSINDTSYDLEDIWENHRLHGDNLHPAKRAQSAKFSSLGCLVVAGDYECTSSNRANGTHTGEWAEFRKALGLTKRGTGDHGKIFDVVLLTGLEAAVASRLVKSGADTQDSIVQEALGRIRQGSRGERVKRLQRGLGLAETGVFSHDVVKAWTDRQKRDFAGKSQGIYGPDGDTVYPFDVFAPLLPAVAGISGQRASYEALQRDRASENLEQLYYEIGLHAEATRRNPSANTSTLESLVDSNLEAINLEYGLATLKSAGASIVAGLERQLQQRICADPLGNTLGRDEIRKSIDDAAGRGVDAVKKRLAQILTGLVTGVPFMPSTLAERIVDALFERILRPAAGGAASMALDQIDLSAQWFCQRWCDRLGAPGSGAAAHNPQGDKARVTDVPPQRPVQQPLQPALPASAIAGLLSRIEQSAKGPAPDTAGVRQTIKDLHDEVGKRGADFSTGDAKRLLAALCDTPVMEQLPGAIGGDPYALMRQAQSALSKTPPDKAAARKILNDLHALLADAHMKLQPQEVKALLKRLRDVRMFDELSWMADRFVARDPELVGIVTNAYAQGLIDSGRIVAGIEILHAADDLDVLSADDKKDAFGILGRGHKQIYVNHIKTSSDAIAARDSIGKQLRNAIDCYGRYHDPARAGDNYYHGVNYIALLKRAERDGLPVEAKGNADAMARGMIAALEPKAVPQTEDPWLLASVAEAYLALGRLDKAAEFFGLYTQHPRINAFALNGTIRQLEEVWQLKAGAGGADAILTNMKAALAQKENGFVSLQSAERAAIAKAGAVEFQQYFETTTSGGKYINFGLLKRIVACGASVAAIQLRMGNAGRTLGTGFLVKGADFSPSLSGDKSYVLTNAHVIWDHSQDAGREEKAISPDVARIVFENDMIDGRPDAYGCRVVWQSPSGLFDATLLELDRKVGQAAPLDIAPSSLPLSISSETSRGTKLAVLGHPQGGNLSIGVLGSLDEMQGTLVDRGPRANSENPIYLHYMTPTEPGNSGSPVFEADNWRVVGLHHAGFPDGGRPKLAGKTGTHQANEGICINCIRAAVRDKLSPEPKRGGRRKWW